jgi:hypothetical protein
MTLFGNRVFANIMKSRFGHTGFEWDLIQCDWRRHTDTEGTQGMTESQMGMMYL